MRTLACWTLATAVVACGGTVVSPATNGGDGDGGGSGAGSSGGGTGSGGGGGASNPCSSGTPTFLAAGGAQQARSVASDGTRVYWTTWGKDDSQGGGMIQSAPVDAAGATTTLASGEGTTTDVAVDAHGVYWMNYGVALRAMPKEGGAPVTLMSTDEPMSFAIDDTSAYVTTTGGIWRVALAGGTPQKIVDASADLAIAVDDAYVYWADRGTANDDATTLSRAPKTGGPPEVLAAGPGVFRGALNGSIAVDASRVYWVSTLADGVVATIPKAGGTPTTLVSGLVCPYTLRMDGDALFYANAIIACGPAQLPGRTIDRASSAGAGAPSQLDIEHEGMQGAFAIDARNVYWSGGPKNQNGVWCVAR
jgi:hypothetical protein